MYSLPQPLNMQFSDKSILYCWWLIIHPRSHDVPDDWRSTPAFFFTHHFAGEVPTWFIQSLLDNSPLDIPHLFDNPRSTRSILIHLRKPRPNLLTIINDQHLPKVHYCSRYIQFSAAYVDIPLLDLDRNHPIIVLVIDTLYPISTPFISQPSETIQPYALVIVGQICHCCLSSSNLAGKSAKVGQKKSGSFSQQTKLHWYGTSRCLITKGCFTGKIGTRYAQKRYAQICFTL